MPYENKIKFDVFGSSHSEEIGVRMEGVPFGEEIDLAELQAFVNRRRSVLAFSTKRVEPDEVIIERGIENGVTTGGEIVAKIKNTNVRRGDYSAFKNCPRPSHCDYAALKKYGEDYDVSGGGVFSGRMTAPMCIAGGIAVQMLRHRGVSVCAYIKAIGGVDGEGFDGTSTKRKIIENIHNSSFPLINDDYKADMEREITSAAESGDSCGGVVECCIFDVPAGSGNPFLGNLESEISRNVFAIPAVKGIEFGSGFALAAMRGSTANDEFYFDGDGQVKTYTNHSGGINGGLANGMPIVFRVAFRPVPSISKRQRTVDLKTGENTFIEIGGRHDACVVPRAVPVVEAMAALAMVENLVF